MDIQEKKVVFITGSSKGIGYEIAKKLEESDWQVVINGRDSKSLDNARHLISNSFAIQADMTNVKEANEAISQIIAKFGRLDAVVCNVGGGSLINDDLSGDEWQRMFSLNFWSAFNIIMPSIDHLRKQRGAIVCVSSICGLEHIPGAPISYSVAKAALNSYVKNMSKKLGHIGVRINAVAPGNILFEGSTWDKKIRENASSINKYIDSEVALKKFGKCNDVAFFVDILLSKNSSFITGTIIAVDGGQVKG